ncbi:uncharacterized protein C7orf62-like isoform X2 [Mizuhopecten yessoensis]|uniref:uncharacterized protein C7orf62-like isoform X2 n=1 Tax=Mizuhopecten yessoensis TaxID=6573 RepID=UPI000B45DE33|nr:uncharacterized protein C7orf62-like isoform X2 [Mizuhopecten yessoensis]
MAEQAVVRDLGEEVELEESNGHGPPSPKQDRRNITKKGKTKKKADDRIKFDWPKRNYFEISCEIPTMGLKNLIHRFVYVAKLKTSTEDRAEIGSHYERFFKNLQNVQQSSEVITGLLLVYLKHIVHIVETSTDLITETVRDIQSNINDSSGLFESGKILIISHDIPHRLYGQWSFRTLDIQAARMESYDSNESTDKIVIEILIQLLKLGNHLAKTPKLNLKNLMDSLHERVPDLLPQQAVLHYLCEDNDPCLVRPQDYLDMYDKPFDAVLDSEMVWPLATRLFPYN